MDEFISERVAETMNVVISLMLSEAFLDRSETHTIMRNIFDNALARSIEKGHLDHFVGERLMRILET